MSDWQPIGTCPLDTWVLVFCGNYAQPRIARRRYDGWEAMDQLVDDVDPSHWMPLPKPPAGSRGTGEGGA